MDERQLTMKGRKLRAQASEMAEHDPEARAEVLAATLGAAAGRAGWTDLEIRRWLQSAYGEVWVAPDLRPGLEMKKVADLLVKSANIARRRAR